MNKLKILSIAIFCLVFALFAQIQCMDEKDQNYTPKSFFQTGWEATSNLDKEINPPKNVFLSQSMVSRPILFLTEKTEYLESLSSLIINSPIESLLVGTLFMLPYVNAASEDKPLGGESAAVILPALVIAGILYCFCPKGSQKRETFLRDISDARKAVKGEYS